MTSDPDATMGVNLYGELSDAGGQLEIAELAERLGVPEEKAGEYATQAARDGYVDVSGDVITLTVGDYV